MDTILASIRRILNEDEVAPAEAAQDRPGQDRASLDRDQGKPPVRRDEDDVLVLGEAMMVPEKIEPVLAAPPPPMLPTQAPMQVLPPPVIIGQALAAPVIAAPPPLTPPPVMSPSLTSPSLTSPLLTSLAATPRPEEPALGDRAAIEGLVAARTRAATAQSFDALHEALLREQAPPVAASPTLLRAGGPTIEELVRDELRMLLSNWLDVHLPVMVEGMVRAEIEKLTRR